LKIDLRRISFSEGSCSTLLFGWPLLDTRNEKESGHNSMMSFLMEGNCLIKRFRFGGKEELIFKYLRGAKNDPRQSLWALRMNFEQKKSWMKFPRI